VRAALMAFAVLGTVALIVAVLYVIVLLGPFYGATPA
jgi:hypothetical protein